MKKLINKIRFVKPPADAVLLFVRVFGSKKVFIGFAFKLISIKKNQLFVIRLGILN